MSVAEERRPLLPDKTAWRLLRKDLWLGTAVSAFGILVILYLVLEHQQSQWLTFAGVPALFLLITIAASLRAAASTRRGPEKQFWRLLAGALLLWLSAVVFASPLGAWSMWRALFSDVSYGGFYTLLIVAVETRPHRRFEAATGRMEYRLMAPAAGFFVGGWLAYFSIVTVAAGLGDEESVVPSLLLFSLLDAYVTGRLLQRAVRTTGGWGAIYGLLSCGGFGFLLTDLFPVLRELLRFEWQWSEPVNVLWGMPFLFFVAAARLAAAGPRSAGPLPARPIVRPLPTVLWTLSFPVLHVLLKSTGWLASAGTSPREIVVLVMVPVLGAYALLQRHVLVRHSLELWREHRRIEEALKESEQDLLLMIARGHQQAAVERHEQIFQKAFEASPDGLSLSTWHDGEVLDANQGFAEILGRRREEIVGRSAHELGLWRDVQQRQAMLDQINAKGSLHFPNVELRRADGESLRVDLSIEKVEADDGPILLAVTKKLHPDHLVGGRPSLRIAHILTTASMALMVADAAAELILVNERAEEILGQTSSELMAASRPSRARAEISDQQRRLEGPLGSLILISRRQP